MDNILRLFHHLAFGNPQSRFGNSRGKIIDFYSIKLPDGYFNRIQLTNTQRNLPSQQQGQRLIFQLAQGQIGFRKKITASTGRVQKGQSCQLSLKSGETAFTSFGHSDLLDFLQLRPQIIQKTADPSLCECSQ